MVHLNLFSLQCGTHIVAMLCVKNFFLVTSHRLGPRNFSTSLQLGGVSCFSGSLINIFQCSYSTGTFDPSCTREVDATVSCCEF